MGSHPKGTVRKGLRPCLLFHPMAWQIPCLCTAQLLAYTKPLPLLHKHLGFYSVSEADNGSDHAL